MHTPEAALGNSLGLEQPLERGIAQSMVDQSRYSRVSMAMETAAPSEGERKVESALFLLSSKNEVCGLPQLVHGADAVVILFVPYCYGEAVDGTMESLLLDVNESLEDFYAKDLRVVCVTREMPSTTRHWVEDRSIRFDVYSDLSLGVSNALVGSFDLSLHLLATRGVQLGAHFVPLPAVVVIGGDGSLLEKYIAPSPESVDMTAEDILKMCGVKSEP